MSNQSTDTANNEKFLEKLGIRISALALIIWCIPGIAIISNVFSNRIDNRIGPGLPNSQLEEIEKIVDRRISTNTDLINILLFVLTALPIVGNFYFWLLYKSVRAGMIDDSTKELEKKINDLFPEELRKILDQILPERLNEILGNDEEILKRIQGLLRSNELDTDIKNKLLELLNSENDDSFAKIIKQNIRSEIMDEIKEIASKIDSLSTKIDNNKKSIIESVKNKINNSINIKLNEEDIIDQIKQELKNSIEEIKQQIKQQFEDQVKSADEHKDKADNLFAQGNYLKAIIYYQWAILYDSNNPYYYYKIAEAHRQLKEHKSAISYFNKVIQLDKDQNKYHTAHYYKAACHALEKQEHESIESLKKAISLKPDEFKEKAKDYNAFNSIQNPYYKACFYALIDRTDKALEELKKAIEKNQEFKLKAKEESAFDSIKDNDKFKELIK
jgi:hypothetical protein